MNVRTLAAVSLMALPITASAETATLASEAQGVTLHHGTVDMSVYWTRVGAAFEVVGIYASKVDATDNGRVVMSLEDGDDVIFGLPGQAGQLFSFARIGDSVTVATARPSVPQVAMN